MGKHSWNIFQVKKPKLKEKDNLYDIEIERVDFERGQRPKTFIVRDCKYINGQFQQIDDHNIYGSSVLMWKQTTN